MGSPAGSPTASGMKFYLTHGPRIQYPVGCGERRSTVQQYSSF